MKCDLHIHTDCSDGAFSPEQIVELACDKKLDCIAVTDHDTVAGVLRAKNAAEGKLQVLSGMELSSVGDREVHILAYNFQYFSDEFHEIMQQIAELRHRRNILMEEKLKAHGFDIDYASRDKSGGSVGRADFAKELVTKGYCDSVAEAFEKYLGAGKSCYVQSRRLTPFEAVRFVLKFGGVPVLAHPRNLRLPFNDFEKFLRPLAENGLKGIEAQYFTHNKAERKFYGKMAKKYRLIVTGGSDFHDYSHGVNLGTCNFVPNGYTGKILEIK